jgi:hypothetical protein
VFVCDTCAEPPETACTLCEIRELDVRVAEKDQAARRLALVFWVHGLAVLLPSVGMAIAIADARLLVPGLSALLFLGLPGWDAFTGDVRAAGIGFASQGLTMIAWWFPAPYRWSVLGFALFLLAGIVSGVQLERRERAVREARARVWARELDPDL